LGCFGASFRGGGFLANTESKSLLWIIFGAETVSIFIVTEGVAGGFSYDIVITTLFIYLFALVTLHILLF
jgi:hypothetical protein